MKKVYTVFFILLCVAFDCAAQQDTSFKPGTSLWGLMFGDYFYKSGGENPGWASKGQYANVSKDFHSFQLRRLYFGCDFKATPNLTAHILLEANDKSLLAINTYSPFIKQAYMEWKNPIDIGAPITVNIGLIPTPVFTITERTWGYRSVEKDILDSRGISAAADFGVSVSGTFDEKENYGYNFMIGNGTGVKAPDFTPKNFASREKEIYSSLYARLLERRLTLEGFFDFRDGEVEPATGAELGRMLFRGFASYQIPKVMMIGVEAGRISNQNAGFRHVSADTAEKTKIAADITEVFMSFFASAPLTFLSDDIEAFARYDFFDNDNNYDVLNTYVSAPLTDGNYFRNYKESLLVLGMAFRPAGNMSFIPNVEINSYKKQGGSVPERTNDVTLRMTFFYIMR